MNKYLKKYKDLINFFIAIAGAFSAIFSACSAKSSLSLSESLAKAQLSPNFYITTSYTPEPASNLFTQSLIIRDINTNSSVTDYSSDIFTFLEIDINSNKLLIPLKSFYTNKLHSINNPSEVYNGNPYNYSHFKNISSHYLDQESIKSINLKTFIKISYTDFFNDKQNLYYSLDIDSIPEKISSTKYNDYLSLVIPNFSIPSLKKFEEEAFHNKFMFILNKYSF